MGRLYNVHSTNTMASELLVNPLKRNGTFDVRSVNYVTSFYLLVMGKWGSWRHVWKRIETCWGDWEAFAMNWSRLKRIGDGFELRRDILWCLSLAGTILRHLDWLWGGLRRITLNSGHIGWRWTNWWRLEEVISMGKRNGTTTMSWHVCLNWTTWRRLR